MILIESNLYTIINTSIWIGQLNTLLVISNIKMCKRDVLDFEHHFRIIEVYKTDVQHKLTLEKLVYQYRNRWNRQRFSVNASSLPLWHQCFWLKYESINHDQSACLDGCNSRAQKTVTSRVLLMSWTKASLFRPRDENRRAWRTLPAVRSIIRAVRAHARTPSYPQMIDRGEVRFEDRLTVGAGRAGMCAVEGEEGLVIRGGEGLEGRPPPLHTPPRGEGSLTEELQRPKCWSIKEKPCSLAFISFFKSFGCRWHKSVVSNKSLAKSEKTKQKSLHRYYIIVKLFLSWGGLVHHMPDCCSKSKHAATICLLASKKPVY